MSRKARMFNKKASDPKNRPDLVLNHLELQAGNIVADIGSGGGYFSLRFAEALGKDGVVFAVDTNPGFLEFIKENAREKGLDNVKTVLTSEDSLSLPENVDLVFMRNVCHHIPNRTAYFGELKNFLKEGGHIAILEYRKANHFTFHGLFGHYIPKEEILTEMTQAGFQLEKDLDFLPEQSFTIFSIKLPKKRPDYTRSHI
ncbi:MAG: class I SAM-dependent methyltransferase [Candidatus Bathyarchaeota archaeon]|nr:class I SAM-dependent methyltransferase [Candidatus Bathyarchaeum sp.]